MKPDWCDEATWERATAFIDRMLDEGRMAVVSRDTREDFARALIAARNEGLQEAVKIAEKRASLALSVTPAASFAMMQALPDAIRSRIQKEG